MKNSELSLGKVAVIMAHQDTVPSACKKLHAVDEQVFTISHEEQGCGTADPVLPGSAAIYLMMCSTHRAA